jgi:hypothetical protein
MDFLFSFLFLLPVIVTIATWSRTLKFKNALQGSQGYQATNVPKGPEIDSSRATYHPPFFEELM